uniref:Ribonuclease H-like domain-containing protein n=1 Tax=Tanacetum cinerariifolium TaxID=118510 RepID=A0A6L2K4H9_TANCI|nr:ribonuclease H-like domain-containing protein [Tanacetum cinerariifolium]
MRTKPGVDTLSCDDLYNNLRVFEYDVKGSTGSSSCTQNVASVSSGNTSSTNEVNTAYGVYTSSGHNSQRGGSFSYTDELMYSFFVNQSSGPKLDHEDLEKLDENTGHKARDNGRRPAKQDEPKAMVTIDGEGVNWIGHVEDDTEDYALMAFNSSNSGSDTKVTSCSKECENTYAKLKKLYDEQREQIAIDSIEIQVYTLALKKMSAKDKSGLGYKTQIHEGVLSYENEVLESVFESRPSDIEDSPVNDRFTKVKGMHAVPPPMTRIYMPPKSDFRLDESKFIYDPKQSKNGKSDTKNSDLAYCDSNSSVETLESVPNPIESKPKAVSEPRVWSDAPIIEEYELDCDDECVSKSAVEQEISNCAFINNVKHVKSLRQTVKDQDTCSQNPKVDKRDWTGLKSKRQGLGYGYTRKASFVCGSFSHLIRDCDFHEKRIAKQVELNKRKNKPSSTTSTVRKVNTARQMVNDIRLRDNLFKSHAPIRRPFNRTTAPKANFTNHKINNAKNKTVSTVGGNRETAVKASAEYQDFNGGPIAFGGSKGQITGKGKIKTRKLDFNDVYFVKELQHFNLFFVSQMCDKKNKVLFTDTECLVLSPDFKLSDENQVLLKVSRQHNMYSFNLENIVPSGGLACLIAKATVDKSNKWHMRLGHVNFKNLNKLVKGNLPVTLENKANKTAASKEANNSVGAARASSTNHVNTVSTPVNTASTPIPSLEDIYAVPNDGIFTSVSYDAEGAVADFTNLESSVNVSPIPQSRIYFIHPTTQILGDPNLKVQKKSKVNKILGAHALEELLQFKTQQVWILVDLPFGKKVIGTKWVYRNKKDERGEDKKAKTGLNIEEGNFNKLDDLVGKGADYDVNKRRSTDKIKVLNAEVKGVSVAGETLSTATLAVSNEAKMDMRKFFKCWFHHHTTNGRQFIMSNRHQELASPKANGFWGGLLGIMNFYNLVLLIHLNAALGDYIMGDIVSDVQSAFVANHQILDGPFMLNELFQWRKKKKKQTMLFKVDFENAYDSVRWDYLDDILRKFGFGDKWRGWIRNCLLSSKGSVIVNSSPTNEFQFYRGLKQEIAEDFDTLLELSSCIYLDDRARGS